jgi:hypothetical protein
LGLLIVLAASGRDRDGAKTTLATCEAMIRWAAITTMTSRSARGEPATRQQRWHWPDE